ncbi:hypothetical protein [Arenimonas composti]|uniref:Uncharacterized protein n=1 Tax=Arenimonas composti TR7-09 = DSM 18010 TaxID=1121013 RepID=A0A091C1H2_9GAMM|nr:hypothetical protein [Arenimonas composti]KFN50450.1 hypothetical protein P873_07240 [Arenimonas composti TR7-09 = DSM 18010]
MRELHWFEFALFMHVAFAAVAIWTALRVPGYTREQRRAQILLALGLPALGAVLVYVMARDEIAPPPPGRLRGGSDGEG